MNEVFFLGNGLVCQITNTAGRPTIMEHPAAWVNHFLSVLVLDHTKALLSERNYNIIK